MNVENKEKLTIELVPKSSWYANLRSMLDKADWDKIRKKVYREANYRCEICGGRGDEHPVEAHEIWRYDEGPVKNVQALDRVMSLCPACHEVKHIGLAQIKGRADMAKATLMRVNGWDDAQADEYIRRSFSEWRRRSAMEWSVDIAKARDYGVDLDKYKGDGKA